MTVRLVTCPSTKGACASKGGMEKGPSPGRNDVGELTLGSAQQLGLELWVTLRGEPGPRLMGRQRAAGEVATVPRRAQGSDL